MYKDTRDKLDAIGADMEEVRRPHEPIWEDIGLYIAPGMVRLELSDTNQARYDDHLIINSTATQALDICANGFIAHGTSPGKPWVKLKPEDPGLQKYGPAADFCDEVASIMLEVMEDGGVYEDLQQFYRYMIGYSNGLLILEESGEDVISTRCLPLGQWWVGKDYHGKPNALRRKFRMSVRQVVETFCGDQRKPDWSKVSSYVKECWDRGSYQRPVDVIHVVIPNEDFNPRYASAMQKRWKSCYYEAGIRGGKNAYGLSDRERGTYLHEGGYDQFPALIGQWDVTGDDTYGLRCPGLTALPDSKELQHIALKTAIARDKIVDPPTFGPPWTKMLQIGHLPGQHTAVRDTDLQRGGIRPLYQVDPRILEAVDQQDRIERRIGKVMHVDTFKLMEHFQDRDMTATEVMARQQEQLGQLTGVMNRLVRSVYNPLIEFLFRTLLKQGKLPPVPEELEESKLNIEYVSTMAQAAKANDSNSISRTFDLAIALGKAGPEIAEEVTHVINFTEGLQAFGRSVAAPTKMFRGPEEIQARREAIEQARAQAAQAEQIQALTQSAKNLGSINTGEKNALTDVVGALGGGA